MEHTLIYTIIASIVVAFILGLIAKQLKLPAIFGYLIAGIMIGPNTPGFVADVSLAQQLAEIGIILLMFGVGLHFSFRDLLDNKKIALSGAILQMFCATMVGAGVAIWLGYQPISAFIFGFSLSVASTIVLVRSFEEQKLLNSTSGKIAVSWLIVEDIAMVFALIMLPTLAEITSSQNAVPLKSIMSAIIGTCFKIGGFVVFMLVIGKRFLPWVLVKIDKMRSAELNTLGTLAIALGFALLAYLVFDASLALGAFLAGVMLNETEIGRKSADSAIQIRDAFSVLFFVSVGMLFEPQILWHQPLAVFLTFVIIVLIKSFAAIVIMRLFKQSPENSARVAIGLAQIGEFSFILGSLSLTKGLIPQELYNLVLAGAMLSIVANPFLFRLYNNHKKIL